jgi:hypothetical protein
MNAAEYVNEIVVPTLRESRDEPRSRRRAYLAAITLFHVKDYLQIQGESGIEQTMRASAPVTFDAVHGICNGTKHGETKAWHPVQFTAGDDWDRPPAIFGEMRVGVSRLGDTKGGRDIRSGAGPVDIYYACKQVLAAFKANFPKHLGHCDIMDC